MRVYILYKSKNLLSIQFIIIIIFIIAYEKYQFIFKTNFINYNCFSNNYLNY